MCFSCNSLTKTCDAHLHNSKTYFIPTIKGDLLNTCCMLLQVRYEIAIVCKSDIQIPNLQINPMTLLSINTRFVRVTLETCNKYHSPDAADCNQINIYCYC